MVCNNLTFDLISDQASLWTHDVGLFMEERHCAPYMTVRGMLQDSAARLSTPGASDEQKMIRPTLMHSLEKLFDVGLAGPAAVVFGWRRCGAAEATCGCWARAVWMAGPDMAAPAPNNGQQRRRKVDGWQELEMKEVKEKRALQDRSFSSWEITIVLSTWTSQVY